MTSYTLYIMYYLYIVLVSCVQLYTLMHRNSAPTIQRKIWRSSRPFSFFFETIEVVRVLEIFQYLKKLLWKYVEIVLVNINNNNSNNNNFIISWLRLFTFTTKLYKLFINRRSHTDAEVLDKQFACGRYMMYYILSFRLIYHTDIFKHTRLSGGLWVIWLKKVYKIWSYKRLQSDSRTW